jgi:DNA-binding protein HU-beta
VSNMTKKQLVDLVGRKAHIPKKAATEVIDVFLNEVGRVLSKGERVVLSGFGTFRVATMKGKTVKIPNSDKFISVKSHRAPRFTSGRKLKKQVAR